MDGPPSLPNQPVHVAGASGAAHFGPALRPDAPASSVGWALRRPSTLSFTHPTHKRLTDRPPGSRPLQPPRGWWGAVHHEADEEHHRVGCVPGAAGAEVNLVMSLPPSPTQGWRFAATRACKPAGVQLQRGQTVAQPGVEEGRRGFPPPIPTPRPGCSSNARVQPRGVQATRAGQPRTPEGEKEGGRPAPPVGGTPTSHRTGGPGIDAGVSGNPIQVHSAV